MAYVLWEKVNITLVVHGQQVIILLNKQGISMQYAYSFSNEIKWLIIIHQAQSKPKKNSPTDKQTNPWALYVERYMILSILILDVKQTI